MSGFNDAQQEQICAIVAAAIASVGQGPPGQPAPSGQAGGGNRSGFRAHDIGVFEPLLDQAYGVGDVVTFAKEVVFRDVHLFCERLKIVAQIKGEELVRTNASLCL